MNWANFFVISDALPPAWRLLIMDFRRIADAHLVDKSLDAIHSQFCLRNVLFNKRLEKLKIMWGKIIKGKKKEEMLCK